MAVDGNIFQRFHDPRPRPRPSGIPAGEVGAPPKKGRINAIRFPNSNSPYVISHGKMAAAASPSRPLCFHTMPSMLANLRLDPVKQNGRAIHSPNPSAFQSPPYKRGSPYFGSPRSWLPMTVGNPKRHPSAKFSIDLPDNQNTDSIAHGPDLARIKPLVLKHE